jgi:threonine synthase
VSSFFDAPRPLTWQACIVCNEELLETSAEIRCPRCGGLLTVLHRRPAHTGDPLRLQFQTSTLPSGVWRYRELILPSAGDDELVTYPEGNTPLLERERISRWAGVPRLELKHEGQNPTGSFKDRGMTVAMTQARRIGATAVACASTGNTAASLAAYAAQAGLPALVFVPAGQTALGKLAQTMAYGARTLAIRGDFDQCLELLEASSRRLGLYLLNSINPFRLEGQKTIMLELLHQRRWEVPDWIVLPAGNLGNLSAFGKALQEARDWGLIDRLPRLAAVQAEGAAPFAKGFEEGFRTRHRVQAKTVATAIRIGDPASWDRAAAVIRQTDGVVLAVSDAEIMEAKRIVDTAGVGCEPASAASVAGVRRLVSSGTIRADAAVVAVLTGHLLKDPEIIQSTAARPVEIEARLDEVEKVLRDS